MACQSTAGRREQAAVDRASAEAERDPAALQPGPGEAIEQSAALRKQAPEAIKALGANEDYVARTHEQPAARKSGAGSTRPPPRGHRPPEVGEQLAR